MYNFQEKNLGPDFAKEKMAEFKKMIETYQSFTAMSMPGVGASYFLKYLIMQDFAFFIHIDLYLLPTLSQHEFYRLFHREVGGKPSSKTDEQIFLETKDILKNYAKKYPKVVIIFSRFDQLKKELDANFLSNLQSLTTIAPGKIVLIFTAIKPLYELAPDALNGGNLTFYSKVLYFKPYSKEDLKKLFAMEGHTLKFHPNLEELIEASGGHNQLLHIMLNSQKQNNLLLDKFVRLQLKDLIDYLDYAQKKQIQKLALGKSVEDIDEYLLGVGYVQSTSGVKKMRLHLGGVKFKLFSPILEQYIKTNLPVKLPVKEGKLFKLLRNNTGKVVSKDEIFQNVWGESEDNTGKSDLPTDWALDALIYRLRNSQFMKSHGYIIESHKKVGYTLIQG